MHVARAGGSEGLCAIPLGALLRRGLALGMLAAEVPWAEHPAARNEISTRLAAAARIIVALPWPFLISVYRALTGQRLDEAAGLVADVGETQTDGDA